MNTIKCQNCQTPYQERVSWDVQLQRISVLECPSCGSLRPLRSVPLEPEVESVIRAALIRHRAGQKTYGIFYPTTDTRDLFEEIIEELLDVINYSVFQVLKVRALREKTGNVR